MANKWGIPDWLEKEVRQRDTKCVYCSTEFTPSHVSRSTTASWEHIINDASIINRENIALCCCGCNSSKGQKELAGWLESEYCKKKGITTNSVAPIVKKSLARRER